MTTTSRSTTMLATLAAAIGLVLPGCGDDEPSGPTKAAFVQRADATCDRWDARIDKAQGEQELAELIDGLFDELDSLPTPDGDEGQVDAIVASGRADLEGMTRGEESEGEPFAEFSRLAAAYGHVPPVPATETGSGRSPAGHPATG